jgi:hypothetical protein
MQSSRLRMRLGRWSRWLLELRKLYDGNDCADFVYRWPNDPFLTVETNARRMRLRHHSLNPTLKIRKPLRRNRVQLATYPIGQQHGGSTESRFAGVVLDTAAYSFRLSLHHVNITPHFLHPKHADRKTQRLHAESTKWSYTKLGRVTGGLSPFASPRRAALSSIPNLRPKHSETRTATAISHASKQRVQILGSKRTTAARPNVSATADRA